MNRPDKLLRVHDLLREQCPDLISLSETKKTNFDYFQLRTLDPVGKYTWNWLPSIRTAGGILVGVSVDLFEVISWNINQYCVTVLLKNKNDNNMWRYISVYGTAYEEQKLAFINELHNVMASWVGPTAIGGDFNLIREASEKSSGNINQHWADLFNDWINRFGLLEIKSAGRRFTWANNQDNLIMAILDRVFSTTCWDQMYPTSNVKTLARVGSDHTQSKDVQIWEVVATCGRF